MYETPGLTTMCAAHQDLESVCLDRQLARVKAGLAQTLAEQIYNGERLGQEETMGLTIFQL